MPEKDDQAKDRIVDLSIKRTEDEMAYAAQGFFENITPLWFKWLGWVFATGGVAYLAKETSSTILEMIEVISYFILTFYFLYFFASIRLEPYHSWAVSRPSKFKRFLALLPAFCLGVAMTLGTRALINYVIQQIQIAK